MKLLFIIPYCPFPPRFGGALRVFNLIRQMTRYHEVSVFGIGNEGDGDRLTRALDGRLRKAVFVPKQWTRRHRRAAQLLSVVGGRSHFHLVGWSDTLQEELRRELEREDYDIVQCEFPHMAGYDLPTSAVKFLDSHNVEYDLFRRIWANTRSPVKKFYYHHQYRKFYHEEMQACGRQDAVIVTSQRDRDLFARDLPGLPMYVVPNGVDSSYFSPSRNGVEPNALVFTGIMGYLPNSDGVLYFLDEIFPLIRREIRDAKIYVVGNDPPREIARRNSAEIVVTGYVDDVRPYLDRASAMVVPLRMGGGTRLKVAEAFAMRKPVISTTLGCEGIDVRHGESAMIADDPAAFAGAVVSVLRNGELRNRLATNGYDLMKEQYEWTVVGRLLAGIHEQVHRQQKGR